MAPTLHGPSSRIVCCDCGISYFCEIPPSDPTSHCLNCGREQREGQSQAGQRVVIDRRGSLVRWSIVAVGPSQDDPARRPYRSVKRIVGLPEETITIRDGDLYVDGAILRKNSQTMLALAIPVHLDHFRPSGNELPSRWRTQDTDSGWRPTDRGYEWQPLGASGVREVADYEWLTYHHAVSRLPAFSRGTPMPISDEYVYNQRVSRTLNFVSDCFVQMTVSSVAASQLAIRWKHPHGVALVEWDRLRNEVRLSWRDRVQLFSVPHDDGWQDCQLLFGLWDQQLVLAINDVEIFRQSFEPNPEEANDPVVTPVEIGARGGAPVLLNDLGIFRDIYYTDPRNRRRNEWKSSRRLAVAEYLTLGDNSPISKDSRHDSEFGIIRRSEIIGIVRPFSRTATSRQSQLQIRLRPKIKSRQGTSLRPPRPLPRPTLPKGG